MGQKLVEPQNPVVTQKTLMEIRNNFEIRLQED